MDLERENRSNQADSTMVGNLIYHFNDKSNCQDSIRKGIALLGPNGGIRKIG